MKQLETDLEHLRSQLEGIDHKIQQATHIAVLEQRNEMTKTIDQRIGARFRTAVAVGGFVLALLGGLGLLGVHSLLPSIIRESVGASTAEEIRKMKAQVESDVAAIATARKASMGQPLIVLQTDYGDSAYYMGRLKGHLRH